MTFDYRNKNIAIYYDWVIKNVRVVIYQYVLFIVILRHTLCIQVLQKHSIQTILELAPFAGISLHPIRHILIKWLSKSTL